MTLAVTPVEDRTLTIREIEHLLNHDGDFYDMLPGNGEDDYIIGYLCKMFRKAVAL